jgi:hypothetical protein
LIKGWIKVPQRIIQVDNVARFSSAPMRANCLLCRLSGKASTNLLAAT